MKIRTLFNNKTNNPYGVKNNMKKRLKKKNSFIVSLGKEQQSQELNKNQKLAREN